MNLLPLICISAPVSQSGTKAVGAGRVRLSSKFNQMVNLNSFAESDYVKLIHLISALVSIIFNEEGKFC